MSHSLYINAACLCLSLAVWVMSIGCWSADDKDVQEKAKALALSLEAPHLEEVLLLTP